MTSAHRFAVREMVATDAAAVAALTSQLGYPSRESDIARRYDLIKGRSDARLIVACEINGDVVGWIHVQALSALEADVRAEIWGLVVADSIRGSGAGRLLVEAAESWALERGLDIMGVRSNVIRRDAHAFYEHLGYEVVKTQRAFRKQLKCKI
jgi:GNAT superfamily N-acetyltransferase